MQRFATIVCELELLKKPDEVILEWDEIEVANLVGFG